VNQKLAHLEEIIALAKRLSPRDKVRLIEHLARSVESDLLSARPAPRKSLFGLCSDLGPAPSADEIDEASRQEWANFPREEI
jgi:hypothetical protein